MTTTITVQSDIAEALTAQAQARGLSLEEYLRGIAQSGIPARRKRMSVDEIKRAIDELAMENVAPLPPDFSRDDIYFDHD